MMEDSENSVTLKAAEKRWFVPSLSIFIFLLLVGFFSVGDYGYSWDETFRFDGGDAKLKYYEDWISGQPREKHTSSYPGLFDLPLAAFHKALPTLGTRSEKGHVWSLCFGLLGLLSVWRLTARVGGERAGFWGLVFLATLPRYYGHMFFNPKDIPLAAIYAFGCWALVSFFSKLPAFKWRGVVWIGVAGGLAMSCRIAGFLILCYFGLFVGLYLLMNYLSKRSPLTDVPKDLLRWVIRGALAGGIAFSILFIFWPTLHANPFANVKASVGTVQSFGWSGMVLMDGHFWEAQDLPIYYLPYWLFRTTPEHILLLIALAFGVAALHGRSFLESRDQAKVIKLLPTALLCFAGFFPLIYVIWKDAVVYDGMRHILFAVLPLVAVTALALEWLLRRSSPFISQAIQVGVSFSVALVVVSLLQLHPYQYIYFNALSGGLPDAYNRDETDYWGLSHKEAGEWLNQYIAENDPSGQRIYKVHQRYSRWMLQAALNPERFEMWKPREGADFYVSVTRFNLHNSYPEAELIHVVERQGVPLCLVFALPPFNKD